MANGMSMLELQLLQFSPWTVKCALRMEIHLFVNELLK